MNALSPTVLSSAGEEFASWTIRGKKADFIGQVNWSLHALYPTATHQLDLPRCPSSQPQKWGAVRDAR